MGYEQKELPAVGTIFCWSWGYDQTNVDYFEVVATTRAAVKVRKIGAESVPGSEGFMSCTVRPTPGRFLDDEIMTKRPKRTDWREPAEWYLSMPYGWCGEVPASSKHYASWYA